MQIVKRALAVMAWSGLVILIAMIYVKPNVDECTSVAKALAGSASASYSPWEGCRIEIAPGTWAAWNEIPVRAPHLLSSPGCTKEEGTLCG